MISKYGISIVVATANRPKDTVDLINSIDDSINYFKIRVKKKQKIELIIADNSSNYETKREIKKVNKKYLKYIKMPPLGTTYARDKAINLAKEKYIVITDSDCLVKKNWIYEIFDSITKNNLPDVIQGAYFYPADNSWFSRSESEWDRIRYFKQKQADTRNFIIKKEIYFKINGFDTKHFYAMGAEDLFLMERLKDINGKIIFDRSIIVYHKYPKLMGELRRYDCFGKAAIHVKNNYPELFRTEFSPWALWKNLITFRFGRINIVEFLYQILKLSYFTRGYFIGKKHYYKETKKGSIISPHIH